MVPYYYSYFALRCVMFYRYRNSPLNVLCHCARPQSHCTAVPHADHTCVFAFRYVASYQQPIRPLLFWWIGIARYRLAHVLITVHITGAPCPLPAHEFDYYLRVLWTCTAQCSVGGDYFNYIWLVPSVAESLKPFGRMLSRSRGRDVIECQFTIAASEHRGL
jgi:hypothetical protein